MNEKDRMQSTLDFQSKPEERSCGPQAKSLSVKQPTVVRLPDRVTERHHAYVLDQLKKLGL